MTIRYIYHCSEDRLGSFARLLFRWRGSIYKLLWKETLVFLGFFYALAILYRYILNAEQKSTFELWAVYFKRRGGLIPLTFLLGAFVSFVVTDRWNRYLKMIPWPDRAAMQISTYVHGHDLNGRILRRTMIRYVNLNCAIMMTQISAAFRKRFPKRENLKPFLITDDEIKHFESVEKMHTNPKLNLYSVPIEWASILLRKAHQERRIESDAPLLKMLAELEAFRVNIVWLGFHDWVTIPLVYTQVVTIAIYTFLLSSLLADQIDRGVKDTYPNRKFPFEAFDLFPLFTVLQFIFYMGWLKVAETLMNPFGEDDDDFEINYIADRNLSISYALVDELHDKLPELQKDKHWDVGVPDFLHYDHAEMKPFRKNGIYSGSTGEFDLPLRNQTIPEEHPSTSSTDHPDKPVSPPNQRRLSTFGRLIDLITPHHHDHQPTDQHHSANIAQSPKILKSHGPSWIDRGSDVQGDVASIDHEEMEYVDGIKSEDGLKSIHVIEQLISKDNESLLFGSQEEENAALQNR